MRRGPRVPDLARAGALASSGGVEEWAEGSKSLHSAPFALLGLLLGGFFLEQIILFPGILSTFNIPGRSFGLVGARLGPMGVARLVFVAAAGVVAAESPACNAEYRAKVCPTVCTSTLAEQ